MGPIEELKLAGKLPSPPGVGMAILELTRTDDFSVDEVAHVIQSDPALTGRILKLTNSSRNATVKPVTTVAQAVNRMGMSTVRSVALGFSLISSYRDGSCRGFDFPGFWSESLACALAAQQVSQRLGLGDSSEAYSCGLLHKIGKLGFACAHPSSYGDVLASTDDDGLLDAECQAFDVDHGALGKALLLDWGLPERIAQVLSLSRPGISLAHEKKQTIALVEVMRIAAPIASVCYAGEEREARHRRILLEALHNSGLEEKDFKELCKSVAVAWREWGKILELETHYVPPFDLDPGASKRAEPGPQVLDAEEESEAGLSILIVDEDVLSVRLLSKAIADAKHAVMTCQEGEKALATVLNMLPDIVVCNAELTGTSGIELVSQLRACPEGRQVYFLMLSSDESEEAELHAYRQGVDGFMKKPVLPDLVRAHVDAGARLVAMKRETQATRSRLESQVAEMAVLNRRLLRASLTDPLTDLPNRRSAMETLKSRWTECSTLKDPVIALILIDIDHFKKVNDDYGHDVGDEVLKQTAQIFSDQVRNDEFVARIGGEEFLVVCSVNSSTEALSCAERLRVAVEANHISFGGLDRAITVSLGIATGNPNELGHEALLKAADEALYKAKDSGRNQVYVMDPQGVL